MKTIRSFFAALLAIGIFGGMGIAQATQSSATVTITVTAPQVAAKVTMTPSATSVTAGSTASVAVKVAGTAGAAVPTGSVDLYAEVPGATTYTLVQSFALTAGAVTCSYPIPATAPLGAYSIKAVYQGDANYF